MTEVDQRKLTDFTPDARNANLGTERGLQMLEQSLRKYGAGRSILVDKYGRVIAGNKTLERAVDIGLEDAVVVKTDGSQLVVVQRQDIDLDTAKGRELALADNRIAEVDLNFDVELLDAFAAEGIDISSLWTPDELAELRAASGEAEHPSQYTRKITSPVYEPTQERPPVSALYNMERANKLIHDIDEADWLTDDERTFLRIAAYRHAVIDYSQVAEYYAHADARTQRLMEDNALVIIDFNRAIELGFVRMTQLLLDQELDEYGE
jgi:hypothetical protein